MNTTIDKGGRLVIPARIRKALRIKPGDKVTLILEDDTLKIISTQQAIANAQKLLRRYIHPGRMLSEELIKERKEEASHD